MREARNEGTDVIAAIKDEACGGAYGLQTQAPGEVVGDNGGKREDEELIQLYQSPRFAHALSHELRF